MSISRTLNAYLDRERVHYDVLPHQKRFAPLPSLTRSIPRRKEMAKVVIVKVGDSS